MKARVLGLLGSSLVLTVVAPAFAQTASPSPTDTVARTYSASVVELVSPKMASMMGRDLQRDPEMKRAGSGTERGTVQAVEVDGVRYLVVVYMASADPQVQANGAHMTIECSSVKLNENAPPEVVVSRKLLHAEEGRRTAHALNLSRPDNDKHFLLTYASDRGQDNPSAYAVLINKDCNLLSSKVRYSIPNAIGGSNDGATASTPIPAAAGQPSRFLASYLATNGDIGAIVNGDIDDDYGAVIPIEKRVTGPGLYEIVPGWPGITDTAATVPWDADGDPATPEVIQLPAKTTPVAMATPTDIGRPHVLPIDDRRFLFASSKGQNRPSMHITFTVAEYGTGKILWTNEVLKGDPDKMIYWNQVTIAPLGPNRFAMHALRSNGGGKNTDVKGINEALTTVFDLTGDALIKVAEIPRAPVHQTHSAICSGPRGVFGEEKDTIGIVSNPHTGTGRGGMTFVGYDPGQKKMFFDDRKDRVPTAWYADGQLLANYYGENPMEQGRDFARCIGGVKNPGWGKDKGYMKDVESFFVTVVHGREPGSLRNAMWLSLVPGVTKTAVDSFGNPALSTEVASTPVAEPTPPAPAPKGDGGGCSCSTPGQTTSSNFIGLVLLGLALGGIATRRRS